MFGGWDRAHTPKIEHEEKPKQVKIDADELERIHADLDAATKEIDLLREGVPEQDDERIEALELELVQANAEIAPYGSYRRP